METNMMAAEAVTASDVFDAIRAVEAVQLPEAMRSRATSKLELDIHQVSEPVLRQVLDERVLSGDGTGDELRLVPEPRFGDYFVGRLRAGDGWVVVYTLRRPIPLLRGSAVDELRSAA